MASCRASADWPSHLPLAAHIASLTVRGTDRVDLNIAALNSHDGTSAFRILVTPVPAVCANTQSAR